MKAFALTFVSENQPSVLIGTYSTMEIATREKRIEIQALATEHSEIKADYVINEVAVETDFQFDDI